MNDSSQEVRMRLKTEIVEVPADVAAALLQRPRGLITFEVVTTERSHELKVATEWESLDDDHSS